MVSGNDEEFDLIVVGGGPGGSTLSSFVAMQEHKVLLLERERFPRYQIGESLLPATIHGICVMLGVSEELKKANFTLKKGGTFRWGNNPKPWTFEFGISPLMAGPTSYAYQVERSKFDNILLENAKRKGVDVREQHTVKDIIVENDRVVGVKFLDAQGNEKTARARYIADASGNTTRIAESVGERVYSKFFQNIALFCYYENGKRMPAPNSGNILCAAFDGGWFWYIPLSEKLTSVGAVVAREHWEKLKGGSYEVAMAQFIEGCPLIKEYLASATRVTEGEYGQFRVRKDYSYCNTRFWTPGAALIGDAACFIDPVFSSGVHLATYSALLAARSINTCLRNEINEAACFAEFEKRYRREYSNFYQFLLAFYDMHQDEDSYFWSARKVLSTEEQANEAFIRLVGGVSSSGEPLFPTGEDFFNSRKNMGETFEQVVQGTYDPRADLNRTDGQFNAASFMGDLFHEVIQIQSQAQGRKTFSETPLWEGGLIVSPDGFHWLEAPAARSKASV